MFLQLLQRLPAQPQPSCSPVPGLPPMQPLRAWAVRGRLLPFLWHVTAFPTGVGVWAAAGSVGGRHVNVVLATYAMHQNPILSGTPSHTTACVAPATPWVGPGVWVVP
jgi:hypothetical protein